MFVHECKQLNQEEDNPIVVGQMHQGATMNRLIGKKIEEIFISEYRDIIVFKDSDNIYCYLASGDCCMRASFESINNIKALLNSPIIEVRGSNIGFNWSIKTINGYCDIEFRETTDTYGGYALTLIFINYVIPYWGSIDPTESNENFFINYKTSFWESELFTTKLTLIKE